MHFSPGFVWCKKIKDVSAQNPSMPSHIKNVIPKNFFQSLSPRSSLALSPPMASYNYSSSSSEISTPRSSSPSSTFSRNSSTTTISKRMSLSSRRISSPFNPMGSVDIEAIEAAMKMSALDGLRGYAQDHYGEVKQYHQTEYVPKNMAGGYQVLREPAWNKGEFQLLECKPATNCHRNIIQS
jgi:hypothetical protein